MTWGREQQEELVLEVRARMPVTKHGHNWDW